MTYKSYPFAAASLKVKENRLLTKEKLLRIAEAKDADEACRALAETGYGSGEANAAEFERMIERELKSAYEYARRIAPDEAAFELFLLRADYHNMKVLLKLMLKKEPLSGAEMKGNGAIPPDALKSAVTDKRYASLPPEMKEALVSLDRQFSVKEDVSLIGLYLDTAYAAQAARLVKASRCAFVREYMEAYADLTNVISFIRLKLLGFGREMLKRVLIRGGWIEERVFSESFEAGLEAVTHVFARKNYAGPLRAAFEEYRKTGALFAFEKARDDYLIGLVKKRKNDVFTIAPTIAYVLAKEREADNIRLVMAAKLNGKDFDFVSDRIKEMIS